MYQLTQSTLDSLRAIGLEGNNGIKVFDSSVQGFVIGLGMSKDEAIAMGLLEEVDPNPLWELSKENSYIPHDWIKKHLSVDQYIQFNDFMIGQWQSEYGVFSNDIQRFLKLQSI